MNMFSMKPKFDLAEFLATPAPTAARGRAARRGGMRFKPSQQSKDSTAQANPETTGKDDAAD